MLSDYVLAKSMFDEVLDNAFGGRGTDHIMSTDIKENDKGYELVCDLPGIEKEDLSAELQDGYLIISATVGKKSDENNKSGDTYLRRERFVGTVKRSFYVGNDIKQEDIKAKYEQGVLHVYIPKVETKKVETKNYIQIDG